jgi:hypothetical protein
MAQVAKIGLFLLYPSAFGGSWKEPGGSSFFLACPPRSNSAYRRRNKHTTAPHVYILQNLDLLETTYYLHLFRVILRTTFLECTTVETWHTLASKDSQLS